MLGKRNGLDWRVMAALGIVLGGGLMVVGAADDPPVPDKEQIKRWSKQLDESIGWYKVFAGREPQEAMKPEIVLRWTNPTRLQRGETALVFWTDAGRPEALASAYPWTGSLVYECVSLARGKGLRAVDGERTIWEPGTPGVTFRDLPDAPSPAKTATARLAQMKGIAELFKVTMSSRIQGVENREEMRLLPKPIHRTDLAATKQAHPDLVDGAVFAFVQGTDPEAVLIVEAVRRGPTTTYQYAFARATGWTVEAKLGPAIIWKTLDQNSWNDSKLPAIAVGRPLVD